MAELVDARDLKCLATIDLAGDFFKTPPAKPIETDARGWHLQNDLEVPVPTAVILPWERREIRAKSVAHIEPTPERDRSIPAGDHPHVYLAYSAGRLKIGTSIDVEVRNRGLNSQSAHPVTMLLLIPGEFDLERRLHACLDSVRLHGEWFKITAEMRQFLENVLCSTGRRKLKKAEAEFRKWIQSEFGL